MRRLLVLALASSMPACGGNSSPAAPAAIPTPAPVSRSAITISFEPSPVIAQPSTDPARPFRAAYVMVVRETAGLACNMNLWTETLLNPVTGLQSGTTQFGQADIARLGGGSNFIAAGGSLRITRDFNYSPGGSSGTGRAVDMNVAVQVIDANSNTINATGTVRIQ